jgi:hypothetical protein
VDQGEVQKGYTDWRTQKSELIIPSTRHKRFSLTGQYFKNSDILPATESGKKWKDYKPAGKDRLDLVVFRSDF